MIAVLIAFLRGGRFSKMPRFSSYWALAAAIVLEGGAILVPNLAPLLESVSYIFIIIFLAGNWSMPEVRLILIGVVMNALVIWANGGVMPVAHYIVYSSMRSLPAYDYNEFWHSALTKRTIFPLLSDIIFIPYPVPTLLSCGDIFLYSGIAVLIQRLLGVPVLLAKLAGVK